LSGSASRSNATDVAIETGSKRTFAIALDWPGWSRAAKGEEAALAALAAYVPRYAPVARKAKLAFDPRAISVFRVVERIPGSANTDFGVPHEIAKRDTTPLSRAEADRMAALVKAAWAVFDEVVASAPAELRKGPRGGGRDRDQVIDHVLGADDIYARKLGQRLTVPQRGDRAAIRAFRAAVLGVLEKPSTGKAPIDRGWPQRYAARRIAWHALDHAWEVQDRSAPLKG
jgi:hypothetical protein